MGLLKSLACRKCFDGSRPKEESLPLFIFVGDLTAGTDQGNPTWLPAERGNRPAGILLDLDAKRVVVTRRASASALNGKVKGDSPGLPTYIAALIT